MVKNRQKSAKILKTIDFPYNNFPQKHISLRKCTHKTIFSPSAPKKFGFLSPNLLYRCAPPPLALRVCGFLALPVPATFRSQAHVDNTRVTSDAEEEPAEGAKTHTTLCASLPGGRPKFGSPLPLSHHPFFPPAAHQSTPGVAVAGYRMLHQLPVTPPGKPSGIFLAATCQTLPCMSPAGFLLRASSNDCAVQPRYVCQNPVLTHFFTVHDSKSDYITPSHPGLPVGPGAQPFSARNYFFSAFCLLHRLTLPLTKIKRYSAKLHNKLCYVYAGNPPKLNKGWIPPPKPKPKPKPRPQVISQTCFVCIGDGAGKVCDCTNPACVANKHRFHSGSRACDPAYPLHGKICKTCNDQHLAAAVAIAPPPIRPPNKNCGFCSAAGGMQNLCLCLCGGKTTPNPGGEHYFHITPTAKIAACQPTSNPAMSSGVRTTVAWLLLLWLPLVFLLLLLHLLLLLLMLQPLNNLVLLITELKYVQCYHCLLWPLLHHLCGHLKLRRYCWHLRRYHRLLRPTKQAAPTLCLVVARGHLHLCYHHSQEAALLWVRIPQCLL